MPVSMEFLRGVLGFIGVACAFMLGRTAGLVRRGQLKPTRLYGWIIRTLLCLGAIAIRHTVDVADIASWSLSAIVFALAFRDASHETKEEPVKLEIYPDEK